MLCGWHIGAFIRSCSTDVYTGGHFEFMQITRVQMRIFAVNILIWDSASHKHLKGADFNWLVMITCQKGWYFKELYKFYRVFFLVTLLFSCDLDLLVWIWLLGWTQRPHKHLKCYILSAFMVRGWNI